MSNATPTDESKAAIVATPPELARRDWETLIAEAMRGDPSRLAYKLAMIAGGRAPADLPPELAQRVFAVLVAGAWADHRAKPLGRPRALTALQRDYVALAVRLAVERARARGEPPPGFLRAIAEHAMQQRPSIRGKVLKAIRGVSAARAANRLVAAARKDPRIDALLAQYRLDTIGRDPRRARSSAVARLARRLGVSTETVERALK